MVHDAFSEEASPFRIAYGQTVARGAFAEEIEVAKRTAAAARAARGYDADFTAPLVSRRVATETRRREALLGSIARLAGIGGEGNEEEFP